MSQKKEMEFPDLKDGNYKERKNGKLTGKIIIVKDGVGTYYKKPKKLYSINENNINEAKKAIKTVFEYNLADTPNELFAVNQFQLKLSSLNTTPLTIEYFDKNLRLIMKLIRRRNRKYNIINKLINNPPNNK